MTGRASLIFALFIVPRHDPLSLQCCCHALVLDQPEDHIGRKSELKDQPHSPSTAASSSPERAWTPHATPGNVRRSARHTVSGLSNGCLNICAPRRVASRTPVCRAQMLRCTAHPLTLHPEVSVPENKGCRALQQEPFVPQTNDRKGTISYPLLTPRHGRESTGRQESTGRNDLRP